MDTQAAMDTRARYEEYDSVFLVGVFRACDYPDHEVPYVSPQDGAIEVAEDQVEEVGAAMVAAAERETGIPHFWYARRV